METKLTLIEVPSWVKWTAVDESGERCYFESRPKICQHDNVWLPGIGKWMRNEIYRDAPPAHQNWRDTLERVYEYEEVEL